jgi:hypothetical protein
MDDSEDEDSGPSLPHTAMLVWAACVALLIGPSVLVWIVRIVALAAQCAPGPDPCRGMALGGGLRDTLGLAWAVGTNTLPLILVALIACIAGLFARRPLLGATTLLLLPLAALMLPMAAVFSSAYDGCQISEAGIGDCTLWGAQMGMSFHEAASVNWQILGFAPYSFALALMLGILGWFFARPKPVTGHATANPFRIPDDRFRRD